MTLPSNPEETDRLITERPGDDLFARIKHYLVDVDAKSKDIREKLVRVILDDLIVDHALANALDDVGAVLEYQAQNEGIERPRFNGSQLIKDTERLGKIKFASNICSILELDEETTRLLLQAEVERVWFDHHGRSDTQKLKSAITHLQLPEDVSRLLQDVAKSLKSRSGNDKHGRTASAAA